MMNPLTDKAVIELVAFSKTLSAEDAWLAESIRVECGGVPPQIIMDLRARAHEDNVRRLTPHNLEADPTWGVLMDMWHEEMMAPILDSMVVPPHMLIGRSYAKLHAEESQQPYKTIELSKE